MEQAQISQFREAARKGDLDTVKTCIAQAGDDARELLTAKDCLVFRNACFNGHTTTASFLLTTAGEIGGEALQEELLTAEDCGAFRSACYNGHTDIASHLLTTAGEIGGEALQKEFLTAANCGAFRLACAGNHTDIASHLLTTAGEIRGAPLQRKMLAAMDYDTFRNACYNSHTDTATLLLATAHNIGGLPLVKNILSATVADSNVMGNISTQQTAGAAIGDILAPYVQKGIDSLRDVLHAIPPEWHEHIPNRRRLILEAERKEQQEMPRGRA